MAPSAPDPAAFAGIRDRWQVLARAHPAAVRLADPIDPDAGVGVPQALRPAASAFPGVWLGYELWGWPTDGHQAPSMARRSQFQAVWWEGREGVCVRVDPGSREPGPVVSYTEEDVERVLADDVLAFWGEVTGRVEQFLPDIAEEVDAGIAADELDEEQAGATRGDEYADALGMLLQGLCFGRGRPGTLLGTPLAPPT